MGAKRSCKTKTIDSDVTCYHAATDPLKKYIKHTESNEIAFQSNGRIVVTLSLHVECRYTLEIK